MTQLLLEIPSALETVEATPVIDPGETQFHYCNREN